MKEREEKNSGRKKKVRKKSRTTEFSITIVLCCLVAVLTVKGISLQQKVNANASRLSGLDSQIEEEKQRTDDITALKEYMQTDEYIEKTAREKLGMVKDNEILFKESQSKKTKQIKKGHDFAVPFEVQNKERRSGTCRSGSLPCS